MEINPKTLAYGMQNRSIGRLCAGGTGKHATSVSNAVLDGL
jgi:hypothetical protein